MSTLKVGEIKHENFTGTTQLKLDNSGRVLVGTTTEGQANADNLTIDGGDAETGITIRSSSSRGNHIYFSDGTSGDDEYRGIISYQHSDNRMQFFTDASERMRIDSSGRVLIGTTTEGDASADNLTVADSGESGITVRSGSSNGGHLYFSDATSGSGEYQGAISYQHNGNFMKFNTSATERMRIDSSGNIGIGTSDPSGESINGTQNLVIMDTTSDGGMNIKTGTSANAQIHFSDTSGNGRGRLVYAHSDDSMKFFTAGSERMRILADGRVGIGDTTPSCTLEMVGTSVANFGSMPETIISYGTSFAYNSGSAGAGISLGGYYNSTPEFTIFAGVHGAKENTNDGNFAGKLLLSTRANGGNSAARVKISSNGSFIQHGEVFYATSTVTTSGGVPFAFYTGGSSVDSVGTVKCRIHGDGDIENVNGNYGSISDIKLKENIVDANSQWDDIKAIKIRNYNFKAETTYPTHTQIGLIAQELELVCPKLVTETPDVDSENKELGTVTKSVNLSVLYMKAVKCLQEAMTKIEVLETKVAALEAA